MIDFIKFNLISLSFEVILLLSLDTDLSSYGFGAYHIYNLFLVNAFAIDQSL
jgi:hypothetical protein